MTPDALRHVIENYRKAHGEFCDALLAILIRPAQPKPTTAPEPEPTPAPKPRTAKHPLPPPLPKPTTQARKANTLTDEAREENLPAATAIAVELVTLLGQDHPQLLSGMRGQLALKHVPHDEPLIAEALAAAKRTVR